MSLCCIKPTIQDSEQVRHKPACTITEVAKTKMLINCAVTAQLTCVFVSTFANCWFSNAAAQTDMCMDDDMSV